MRYHGVPHRSAGEPRPPVDGPGAAAGDDAAERDEMSRESTISTAWCAACRRDVTLASNSIFVPHTPVPGRDRTWCPGTSQAPHAVETEVAEQREQHAGSA